MAVMKRLLMVFASCAGLWSCSEKPAEPDMSASQRVGVTAARIIDADSEPGQWLAHGRTYSEQRYSPLDQINDGNVDQLGLAWHYDFATTRGLEASPLVIDGVIYTSSDWSIVYAFDARTGALLWEFDPQVPGEKAFHACCDVVNRGVAAWEGKIYIGTLDGRLIAIDAKSGEKIWSVATFDPKKSYTITGAPRIVKGNVIIGNGGGEYGVRGYITAYDANTGAQNWRFYTVPGNPADGFESDALEMAAQTWNGEWWRLGGGGTVWDSMAYDPQLDLLYIGVGNGSPWNQALRSPGGGDNLFLSSIVAIKPDTGDYVWHFQTTPGETWDFTATQHIILADLEIDGTPRKVLMQAPKNGYFYVIDRVTGAFISGENFVPVNWATGLDEAGRPIEVPQARYEQTGKPYVTMPSGAGAHSWHPMAYSPDTNLVYIPAQELPMVYDADKDYEETDGYWNLGIALEVNAVPDTKAEQAVARSYVKGHLAAWDPITQTERWRVQHDGAWNGGILTTAGNLVFQGLATAELAAYTADTGQKVWSFPTHTGVIAPPVSYSIDGEQYIAVMAGWGGAFALTATDFLTSENIVPNANRLLVFKVGGTDVLPARSYEPVPWSQPPVQFAAADDVAHGAKIFTHFCGNCHGAGAAGAGLAVPDLRRSYTLGDADMWRDIVIDGALSSNGMISFAKYLTLEDAEAVRAYVIDRANAGYRAEKSR